MHGNELVKNLGSGGYVSRLTDFSALKFQIELAPCSQGVGANMGATVRGEKTR